MIKKVLIVAAVFYLLGVFGVGIGVFTTNLDGDWSAGDQLADALRIGFTWPLVVFDLAVGA